MVGKKGKIEFFKSTNEENFYHLQKEEWYYLQGARWALNEVIKIFNAYTIHIDETQVMSEETYNKILNKIKK
ncbi:MAG: hypothetical protein ACTSQG_00025 [Promethearchaeota archaeon]